MALSFAKFSSGEQAEQALYNALRRYVSTGNGSHSSLSPFVLMLPGGATPQRVYSRFVDSPPSTVHPQLFVMLSDDRFVPEDSPDSNYSTLSPALDAIRLPEDRRIRINSNATIEESVADYSRQMEKLASANATFSAAVLGIGADGHTAGLFDPDAIPLNSDIDKPWATQETGPDGLARVTATAQFILKFKRLVFFATGEGKRQILYDLSRDPAAYPAGRIALQHDDASIWTDVAPNDQ